MTFQKQEPSPEEAELAWHLHQLLHASLTDREREYHRDMISWLEQQYGLHPCGANTAVPGSTPPKKKRRRVPMKGFLRRLLAGPEGIG